jgi:hemoglobin
MSQNSLYERLGGYDGITAFASELLPRLQGDDQLGRFWAHRGEDGLAGEKQLLIDYLAHVAGGPMYYTGRDMKTTHQGMKISESDWNIFMGHAADTMAALQVPQQECDDIAAFVLTLKDDIVEA